MNTKIINKNAVLTVTQDQLDDLRTIVMKLLEKTYASEVKASEVKEYLKILDCKLQMLSSQDAHVIKN